MSNFITPLDSDLERIAARIRAHVAHATLDIGRLLIGAKAKAEHGQWQPFLERAGLHKRTAQRLMRITRAVDDGELCAEVLDRIGIKAALRQLARPKSDTVSLLAKTGSEAQAWWRAAMDAYSDDPDERAAIRFTFPDGPLSAAAWAAWGDAVLAGEPAAAWQSRPWAA